MFREPYSPLAIYHYVIRKRYGINLRRRLVSWIADYLLRCGVELYNPVPAVVSDPNDSVWCDRDPDGGTNILRGI